VFFNLCFAKIFCEKTKGDCRKQHHELCDVFFPCFFMRGMMRVMNFHFLKYKLLKDKIDSSSNQKLGKYY